MDAAIDIQPTEGYGQVGTTVHFDDYYTPKHFSDQATPPSLQKTNNSTWFVQSGSASIISLGNGDFTSSVPGSARIEADYVDLSTGNPLQAWAWVYFSTSVCPGAGNFRISPAATSTVVGGMVTFSSVSDCPTNNTDVTLSSSWKIPPISQGGNSSVATLTQPGQFKGLASGTTKVEADYPFTYQQEVCNPPDFNTCSMQTFNSTAVAYGNLQVTNAPDFSFIITPSSQSIPPGSSATFNISSAAVNGFNSPIVLSAVNLPTGVTAVFTPSPITPPQSSVLTVTVAPTAAPGSYAFTVRGTSGGTHHDYSVNLIITYNSVSLAANTVSGNNPLTGVVLTAVEGGNEQGNMNYTFWWDCSYTGADLAGATAACGNPATPSNGEKYDATSNLSQSTRFPPGHTYAPEGTYTAKVIMERGSSAPATAMLVITVAPSGGANKYSCSNNCAAPIAGGTYTDAAACQTACAAPTQYSCSNNCATPIAGGTYSTQSSCQSSCGLPSTHSECVNSSCQAVPGAGPDRCATAADCGNGGGSHYAQCDALHQACVNVSGNGSSTCSADTCGSTRVTHLECQNNSCVIVGGAGSSACATPGAACGPGAITCTFTSNPAIISSGATSTLSWSCNNNPSCTVATPSARPVTSGGASGSVVVSPTSTASYTLTCSQGGNNATRSATVAVYTIMEIAPK